jgi:hypothetical protein
VKRKFEMFLSAAHRVHLCVEGKDGEVYAWG